VAVVGYAVDPVEAAEPGSQRIPPLEPPQRSPARLSPSGTTPIFLTFLETESADFLCQALKANIAWVLPCCPVRSLRIQEFPLIGALLRTLAGVPGCGDLLNLNSFKCESIKFPRLLGN
jgi:hypothetical protein